MSSEIAPSTPLSAESIAKSNHETGGVIESSGGAGAGATLEASRADASVLARERAGGKVLAAIGGLYAAGRSTCAISPSTEVYASSTCMEDAPRFQHLASRSAGSKL